VAGAAPTLAGATTTAAFNLGNTSGPWIGGTVIDAGLGFSSTAWAGAAITAAGMGAVALSLRLQRRGNVSRVVAGAASTAENPVPSEA